MYTKLYIFLKELYGWNLNQSVTNQSFISIPVGIYPGIISKTINLPSGESMFDDMSFETILRGHLSPYLQEVPSVLIEPQVSSEITMGASNISEIVMCEKDFSGYCLKQESLKTTGFLLNNELSQGKYLNPSMCIMDCKTKAYEVIYTSLIL